MLLLAVAALAGLGGQAFAAAIETLEIEHDDGRYELRSRTFLAAPADAIFEVLTDYDDNRFGRISSVYKVSGYLEPEPDGTPVVHTVMEGCVLFFCKSMQRIERLETIPPTFIRTTTLPDREGDFDFSRSEWVLEPADGGTTVIYRLTMEPNFWVPPVVGPWLLKRRLLEGGERAINRIERLALELTRTASSRQAAD